MHHLTFFLLITASLHAAPWDRVETWPLAASEQRSAVYRVTVNDQEVPVSRYQADGVGRSIAVAHFAFSGTARVRVNCQPHLPAGIILSPQRLMLPLRKEKDSLSFELDTPRKLALHFGGAIGLDAAEGLTEKLFLFADALEPEGDDDNVVDALKAGVPGKAGFFVAEKLQSLLDALPEGGMLRLGPGVYDLDRRIEMRSRRTVRVEGGAVVRFTSVNPGGKGMFHFEDIEHAALIGRGVLHLNGSSFRNAGAGYSTCQAVRIDGGGHHRIEGLTLRDAGNMNVFVTGSSDNVFRDLKIIADADFSNTDGIGLNDGCERNTAEDLFIYNTDDCIVAGFLKDMSGFTARNGLLWNHGTGRAMKAGTEKAGRSYSKFLWENMDVVFSPSVIELRWQNDEGRPVSRDLAFEQLYLKNIHAESAPTHYALQLCCGSARQVWFQNLSFPGPAGRTEGNGFRHEEWGGGRVWSRIQDVTVQHFVIGGKVAQNAAEAGLEHQPESQKVRFVTEPLSEVQVRASTPAVKPGAAAVFEFTRNGGTQDALSLAFALHGSAVKDRDYTLEQNSLRFAPGASTARVSIQTNLRARKGVTLLLVPESEMSSVWTLGMHSSAQITLHPEAPTSP
jgi:hypothetical protein